MHKQRAPLQEKPVVTLARKLGLMGYGFADANDLRISEGDAGLQPSDRQGLGILKERGPSVERGFEVPRPAELIGFVWLENDLRGASWDEQWVWDVYGRGNAEEVEGLAESFGESEGVEAVVNLASDNPRFEKIIREF